MLRKFIFIIILLLSMSSCNSSEKKKENILKGKTPAEETIDTINFAESTNGLKILSPVEGEVVSSPLVIKGTARGTWYFEGVFGVKLLDENYNVIGETYVSATEDWMTEDWVPFEGRLEFSTPEFGSGFLILEKANPSGLEKHSLTDTLKVKFGK